MEKNMELEKQILEKTGWNEKRLSFYGTVIFNVVDEKSNPIADIVSRRDDKEIIVDWFIPNKEGQKITLVFDTSLKELNKTKTDSEINTEKDVSAFLTTIENTVKGIKPQFFPSKKIESKIKPTI